MSEDTIIRGLIIDDSRLFDNVAKHLVDCSKRPRIVFDTATSGAEAMLQFTADPHQLVFLNLELAEDNSLALLKNIKKISWFTDVVGLCSRESPQLILAAMRNFASDVLLPPFSRKELECALARCKKRIEIYTKIQGDFKNFTINVENRLKAISHDTKNFISSASQSLEILENEIRKLKANPTETVDWEPLLFYSQNVKDILEFCLENLVEHLDHGLRKKIQNDPLEFNEFDLAEMLREVVEDFRPICSHKAIPLLLETEPPPTPYYGRQGDIYHILTNLIQNSIKYSDPGQTIRVSMNGPVPMDENVGIISLMVADSGHGITPEALPHIFDKGFAGDPEAKNSGFGLYFVKKVVEEHNGDVVVQSEPDQGTVISINLPVLLQP